MAHNFDPRFDDLLRRRRSANAANPANLESGFTPPPTEPTLRQNVMDAERAERRGERLGIEEPGLFDRAGEGEIANNEVIAQLLGPGEPDPQRQRFQPPTLRQNVMGREREARRQRRVADAGVPVEEGPDPGLAEEVSEAIPFSRRVADAAVNFVEAVPFAKALSREPEIAAPPREPVGAEDFIRSFGPNTAASIDEARGTRAARDERAASATTPGERSRITGEAFRENLGAGIDFAAAGVEDTIIDPTGELVSGATERAGGFFGGLFGTDNGPPSLIESADAAEIEATEPTGTVLTDEQGAEPMADALKQTENEAAAAPLPDQPPALVTPEQGNGGSQGSSNQAPLTAELPAPPETVDVLRGTRLTRDVPAFSDSDLAGLRLPPGFSPEDSRQLAALRNFGLDSVDSINAFEAHRQNTAQLINASANKLRAEQQVGTIVDTDQGKFVIWRDGNGELKRAPTGLFEPVNDRVVSLTREETVIDAAGRTTTIDIPEVFLPVRTGPNQEDFVLSNITTGRSPASVDAFLTDPDKHDAVMNELRRLEATGLDSLDAMNQAWDVLEEFEEEEE